MVTRQLILFTCPKCRRKLVWANETAIVYCKKCDRWVRSVDIKEVTPVKMDAENDQLTLF